MPRSWADEWDRRSLPLITVAPYALLAMLAGFTAATKRATPGSLLIDLALCALAAAWMLWMITLHPAWRTRRSAMAVFLAGLIVIMAVLVVRDPWFGLFTPAGYFYAFRLLGWPWELPGIAGVAVVAGTAQASGMSKTTIVSLVEYLVILAVNVAPLCGLAWIGHLSGTFYAERERALQQASEANSRLEAALTENAGLQQRLMGQARLAGALDERQRMAREIHDTLAQGLTGIITQLQAAEHASDDPAGWRRHHDAATMLARESLSEARRSVNELQPEPLETARLSEALADVARRWSALHGVAVQVTTTGTARPMRPEAEVALLRTAQEALANVARHAQATRVGLTLSYMDHEVALDVRDDGEGFDPQPAGSEESRTDGGFGLVAMRQRIEGLSGTLQVESEPGFGTGISACLPFAPAEARA
jgi:signal transduction histidine kinase